MTRSQRKKPGIRRTLTPESQDGPPAPPADGEGGPDAPAIADAPIETTPAAHFPIVGIGASAGGLAAFEAFFSAMPADPEPGMAFVLVQHLAPDHKSILTDLVQRYTHMQVLEVTDGMRVKPNCAYIIPPNRDMALLNGTLQLLPPVAPRGLRLPIDSFFRSLAQDQHERAICIVLSGTGSDGTLGVRAVKGEGGMAIVQDPESTEYDGMPRSAIATGLVDYVLAPDAMPAQLRAYVSHIFGARARPLAAPVTRIQDTLSKICVVLRTQTGHDFSQYKVNTLIRRVERRMALHQIERADDYLTFLQHTPAEADGLFRDLLIGVTSFFRDPDAFAVLRTQVIPQLFAAPRPDHPVRVWVCGCSTGEEAYSLAILFQEHLETLRHPVKVQIFATDVDGRAIDHARAGAFPASIAADVSPERLARFFVHDTESGLYRIGKPIRDLLIFSEQDVIKDPPFSRLDLLSCRNLLIYLNADLQRKLIPMFHYALNPGGTLFLGTSETVGEYVTLFAPLDRKWKLYRRQEDIPGTARPPLVELAPVVASGEALPPRLRGAGRSSEAPNLRALTEQSLLAHSGAAGVLVSDRGEILHIYGRTGNYLEPAPGDAGLNILAMARKGLRQELTIALRKAAALKAPVRYQGLQVRTNGSFATVNLTVRPVVYGRDAPVLAELFLVVLEEAPPASTPPPALPPSEDIGAAPSELDQRVALLTQELRAKDEYLQTTIEEMETSSEELKSTNEELQSVNEELQSTNEELETSKEELQSVNEELATVNTELQNKITDLLQINNDMNNLLAGTGVGTLFVDFQLRIARFTPAITQVINLIQTDIGRPVGHIVSNLRGYDRLVEDVQTVLDTLVPQEAEVQTRLGTWYLMRIRPYRTLDNVIEGAVLTFVDITQRKEVEAALRSSEHKFATAIQASPDGLVICRQADGVILDLNPSWEQLSGYGRQETLGRSMAGLELFVDPDAWQRLLTRFQEQGTMRNQELELRRSPGAPRWALVSIETLNHEPQPRLLVVFHEVTERKRAEAALGQLREAEAGFARVFQASPTAQYLISVMDGRITDVNDAFLALFGYQRDEVLGRAVAELGVAPAADRAELLRLARERGAFHMAETTARTKAGATLTVASTVVAIERGGQPHLLTLTRERPPQAQPEASS